MAFMLSKMDVPATPPAELLPATAGADYSVGQMLTLTAGKLTTASGTTRPAYVSAAQIIGAEAGALVPCYRVLPTQEYRAPLSAAGTALHIGDKVTLHTDGMNVTATTTGGVAEITGMEGTAVGSHVTVRIA